MTTAADTDEKARAALVSLAQQAGNPEHRSMWRTWAEILRTEATKLSGQQAFTDFFLQSKAVEAAVESMITHRCSTAEERNDLLFLLKMSLINESVRGPRPLAFGVSTSTEPWQVDIIQNLFTRLVKLSEELTKLRERGSPENSLYYGMLAQSIANAIGALKKSTTYATENETTTNGSFCRAQVTQGDELQFQRTGSSSHSLHNSPPTSAPPQQPQSVDVFDVRYLPTTLRSSIKHVPSSGVDLSAFEDGLSSLDDIAKPTVDLLTPLHDWSVYYLGKLESSLSRIERECALFKRQRDLDATVRMQVAAQADELKAIRAKMESAVEAVSHEAATVKAKQEALLGHHREVLNAARADLAEWEVKVGDVKRKLGEVRKQYDAIQAQLQSCNQELKTHQKKVRELEVEPSGLKQLQQALREVLTKKGKKESDLLGCTYAAAYVNCVAHAAAEVTAATLKQQEEIVDRQLQSGADAVAAMLQRFHVVATLLDECRKTFQENYDTIAGGQSREQLRDLCKEAFVRLASYGEAAFRIRERLLQVEHCVLDHGDSSNTHDAVESLYSAVVAICTPTDDTFVNQLNADSHQIPDCHAADAGVLELSAVAERSATPPQSAAAALTPSACSSEPSTPGPNNGLPDFYRRRKRRLPSTASQDNSGPVGSFSPLEAVTAAMKRLAERQTLQPLW